MSERNGYVSYPNQEMETHTRDLEQIIVNFAEGKRLLPDQLPSVISASRTEAYANWFASLTSTDPEHQERGAAIHVKMTSKELVYPTNPDVGLDGVGCIVSKKRDVNKPIINVHSHPYDICFSGYNGDLTTLLKGWGEGDDYFILDGMLVATSVHNYLMIKTSETPVVEDEWDIKVRAGDLYDYDEFLAVRRFKSKLGKSMSDGSEDYWPIFEQAEQKFFRESFDSLYNSFIDSLSLAEAYKLGFYFSNKDGHYVRFTKESLISHVILLLDQALDSVMASIPAVR